MNPTNLVNVVADCGRGRSDSLRINFLEEFNSSGQLTRIYELCSKIGLFPRSLVKSEQKGGCKNSAFFSLQGILGNNSLTRCLLTSYNHCIFKKRRPPTLVCIISVSVKYLEDNFLMLLSMFGYIFSNSFYLFYSIVAALFIIDIIDLYIYLSMKTDTHIQLQRCNAVQELWDDSLGLGLFQGKCWKGSCSIYREKDAVWLN